MSNPIHCPQCGEQADELKEGYCAGCCDSNQSTLDDHNFTHDRWARMSDTERGAEIKRAMR